MISHAIAFVTVLVLRQLFDYQNRSRNRKQGVNIDPEAYRAADAEEIIALDKNETDWENQSFRYYL
jgi:hypothetical protein